MTVVISDTSCLILYNKIGELELLRATFSTLIVTEQVALEYGTALPDWIEIRKVSNQTSYVDLRSVLGKGEASAIVLAEELPNSLLIIDEKRGRQMAKARKLPIIGSFGILLKAKQKGVIHSVKPIIAKIEQTDFRISNTIKQHLIQLAGEDGHD